MSAYQDNRQVVLTLLTNKYISGAKPSLTLVNMGFAALSPNYRLNGTRKYVPYECSFPFGKPSLKLTQTTLC